MSKGHLFVDTMLFLIADCILLIVCICLNINKYLKYKKILLSDSDCARYKSNFFFYYSNLSFVLLIILLQAQKMRLLKSMTSCYFKK